MSKEAAGGARKSRRFMKKTITFSMIMVTVKITVKTKCLKCSFQLDWSRFASALTLQCFGTTKITVKRPSRQNEARSVDDGEERNSIFVTTSFGVYIDIIIHRSEVKTTNDLECANT